MAKLNGQMKTQTTFKLLGYTKEELIKHLTKFPEWFMIEDKEWEIDHHLCNTAYTI